MHENMLARIEKLGGLDQELVRVLNRHPSGIRQADILEHLVNAPTQSTVSRHLARLAAQGVVVKTGATKAARFALSQQAQHWSTPSALRTKTAFDPARIRDYEPNVSAWLPATIKEKMESVGKNQHALDASTFSKEIAERFLIDLAWASSSLEGNTYSLLETETLIKYGQFAPDKDQRDAIMILNHKRAISILLEHVGSSTIDERLVSSVHASLMRGLLEPSSLGRVRSHGVRISHSSYQPSSNPSALRTALGEMLYKAERIKDPFEAMFFLTSAIAYIQPFEDGNKRMGRLIGNLPLLRAGLSPISFIGVDKTEYIQGLLAFYELGSTLLLAKSLHDGYASSAQAYAVSHATQRVFRSIELRAHSQMASAMREIIESTAHDPEQVRAIAIRNAVGVAPEHVEDFVDCVLDYQTGLTLENSTLWSVSEDQAKAYLQALPARLSSRPRP